MKEYIIWNPRTYGADKRIRDSKGRDLPTSTHVLNELNLLFFKNKKLIELVKKIEDQLSCISTSSHCGQTIADCEYIMELIEELEK